VVDVAWSEGRLVDTEMGDCLRVFHLGTCPAHPGQLSLVPSPAWEMSTDKSAMMLCGSEIKADMAYFGCGFNVRVAGKTVILSTKSTYLTTLLD